MRMARRRWCRSAKSAPTAALATATAVRAATVPLAGREMVKEKNNGRHQPDSDPPSLPPPAQDLPVLGRQCATDRLQGRAPVAALHFRAWQDRALAHHSREPEEAA